MITRERRTATMVSLAQPALSDPAASGSEWWGGVAGTCRARRHFQDLIEAAGTALDLAGVGLISAGLLFAAGRYALALFSSTTDSYRRFRQDVGKALLLGLEVLVAADIIRTVAITPTLTSVRVLAGIVLIRTLLSFSLQLELEGKFPWQRDRAAGRND
jgi:uncharacterized membrane protein